MLNVTSLREEKKMASKPETIEKMKRAQDLHKKGLSTAAIAKDLSLSESRVKELLKGTNWDSKNQHHKKIA